MGTHPLQTRYKIITYILFDSLSCCHRSLNSTVLIFADRKSKEVLLPLQSGHGPELDRDEDKAAPGVKRGVGQQGGLSEKVSLWLSGKDMLLSIRCLKLMIFNLGTFST